MASGKVGVVCGCVSLFHVLKNMHNVFFSVVHFIRPEMNNNIYP